MNRNFKPGETVAHCGHVIPRWHEVAWHDSSDHLFCSLDCLAASGYGQDVAWRVGQ